MWMLGGQPDSPNRGPEHRPGSPRLAGNPSEQDHPPSLAWRVALGTPADGEHFEVTAGRAEGVVDD